uniref:Uncharacterized protein n=1 Tax=Anguilla anguilla TaxID=7936 RepID=A0A0E9PPH7_ANGAN
MPPFNFMHLCCLLFLVVHVRHKSGSHGHWDL